MTNNNRRTDIGDAHPFQRFLRKIVGNLAIDSGDVALRWMQDKLDLIKKDELYDIEEFDRITHVLNAVEMMVPDVFAGCSSLIERMEAHQEWLTDRIRFIKENEKRAEESRTGKCERKDILMFFNFRLGDGEPW